MCARDNHQVLMIYSLGKKSEKLQRGREGVATSPSACTSEAFKVA